MMGLGDTTRGGKSRGHIALPAEAQEEQLSWRGCRLKKEGSWQLEEDPVTYFGKQAPERRFKHAPLVRGHQKGAVVWWWAWSLQQYGASRSKCRGGFRAED